MKVSDLISSTALGVSLSTPASESSMKATIKSAVTTELIDPGAYLEPESLILTTGISMRVQDQRIWNAYVERLSKAQVVGIVFGHGSAHQQIPPGLVEAGRQLDMPVLQIPTDVSFLQLQHSINQTIAGERYWLSRKAWDIANTCTRAASRGAGLIEILKTIEEKAGAMVWVSDNFSVPFAGTPATESTAKVRFPLAFSLESHWNLFAAGDDVSDLEILLSPSIAVINMVLNNHFEKPLTENSPYLLSAISSGVQDSIPEIDSELISQGLPISTGIIPIRIGAVNRSRRNILARMVSHAVSQSQKELFLQVNEKVFLLVPAPKQIADNSETLKDDFWGRSLGGLVDSDTHDEIIVGHQSQNIQQLLCTLQLLINAPSASGLRMIPPLEFSTLVQLLPPQFKAPINSMILGKVQSSSESAKLLHILDAVCTTTTMTRAAEIAGIHRNTLNAAVAKIERLLQLDLSDPQNRALCLIALRTKAD
jgi:purine catabolism regulator